MIIDANLLLYAVNADDLHHEAAREWLENALNGETLVGLPWQSLSAFLRIVTHPRVFLDPLEPAMAFAQIDRWLDAPRAWIPHPTQRYRAIYGRIVREQSATGRLVPDAALAALAIDHGVAVASADADFARFDLDWVNPLAAD